MRKVTFIIPVLVIAIAGVLSSIFIVDEREKALVLQFGQIRQVKEEPGLAFKIPVIQEVVRYDDRILSLDTPAIEVTPSDDRRLVVDAFARYRISDVVQFRQAVGVGGIRSAEDRLAFWRMLRELAIEEEAPEEPETEESELDQPEEAEEAPREEAPAEEAPVQGATPSEVSPAGAEAAAEEAPDDEAAGDAFKMASGVLLGVERQRRIVLAVALPVRVLGLFLLEVAAVGEHDRREVPGSRRRVHRTAVAEPVQPRQVAAVIDVGVGEHDGVDRVGRHREVLPVRQPKFLAALEHAAVDEDTCVLGLEQSLAARHRLGAAEERQPRRR